MATAPFMARAEAQRDRERGILRLVFRDVRLRRRQVDEVVFRYESLHGRRQLSAWWPPPECPMGARWRASAIHGFPSADAHALLVHEVASASGINPSLLAGLVAQESGFNPKAVSWAKAIGLTQITSIAETTVLQRTGAQWPRFAGLADMSWLRAKLLIDMGVIDRTLEWRLDPRLSLQGGVVFLRYLRHYWQRPAHMRLLASHGLNNDLRLTEVLLASYHSGAARAKRAIRAEGAQWLRGRPVAEARYYVRRVFSYCWHFAHGAGDG
jgi:hypothetical protein